jgi:hypothetical protein
MGIVLCDIHGHGAIVETCRHVAEQIDSGMRPTGQRFTVLTELFICDDCFETLGFERFRRFLNLPAEEFIDIDDASAAPLEEACTSLEGRRIFCSTCITEMERRKPTS